MKRSRGYLLAAFLTTAFVVLSPNCVAHAQDQTSRVWQYWLDFDPTWRLNKHWTADIQMYARIGQGESGWWETGGRPELQYSPRKWIDLIIGLDLFYTHDTGSPNLWETRPYVGIRPKLNIWRGIQLNDYLRLEARFQKNFDTQQTVFAKRLRNRIQLQIPINTRKLSETGTWYVIADVESFYVRDNQIHEPFKDKQRFRLGLGWRRNEKWNYQFIYMFQRTRNNIGQGFSDIDDVFRLRFIPTLN